MHYILTAKVENDNEDAILEGDSDYLNRIECSFRSGISLPAQDIETPILYKIDEFALRGIMTDRLNITDIPGPIFSIRTKVILEKNAILNIEYYQLTLLDEFSECRKENERADDTEKHVIEYTDYFIANIVGLVDCVDHEKSMLEYFYPPELRKQLKETLTPGKNEIKDPFADENPNDIDFMTKLVLDESKIDPNLKIFTLSINQICLSFMKVLLTL